MSSKKQSEAGENRSNVRTTKGDGASQRSTRSSRTAVGFVEFELLPVFGIYTGLGSILYEEDRNSYSYAGAPVDAAAELADLAKGRQILTTSEFMEDLDEEQAAYEGRFTVYTKKALRSRAGQEYELQSYTPAGLTAVKYARRGSAADGSGGAGDDERESGKDTSDGEVTGSISGALQQASSGLTTRRIALAVVAVPELRNAQSKLSSQAHVERVSAVFHSVAKVADDYKADVLTMSDGVFVVAVNALTQASAAPTRAAHAALEIVTKLQEQGYDQASAGLATGISAVGTLTVEDFTHRISCGNLISRATFFQKIAASTNQKVVTSSVVNKDLMTAFYTSSVDFVRHPEGTIVHVFSVVEPRPEAAEDEWMYQLESGDATNPYRGVNAVMADVERTFLGSPAATGAVALGAAAQTFVDMTRNPTADVPDDMKPSMSAPAVKQFEQLLQLDSAEAFQAYTSDRLVGLKAAC